MNNYFLLVLSFVVLFSACNSPKYMPKPKDFSHHVKGLHVIVKEHDGNKVSGEIIAVDAKFMKILPTKPIADRLFFISKKNIKKATILVSTISDDPIRISTKAGLVNLTTLGHGFFMVFTVPITMAMTMKMGNEVAKSSYRIKYPKDISWNEMSKFARFPQGIPRQIISNDIE